VIRRKHEKVMLFRFPFEVTCSEDGEEKTQGFAEQSSLYPTMDMDTESLDETKESINKTES